MRIYLIVFEGIIHRSTIYELKSFGIVASHFDEIFFSPLRNVNYGRMRLVENADPIRLLH